MIGSQSTTCFQEGLSGYWESFLSAWVCSGRNALCLTSMGACYEELSSLWDEQVTKDWETVQPDYKGLVGGWQGILGLYGSMGEKHREIMKTEGNDKEKDCAVALVNTYRIGVQAEQNFFKQELGVDMTHARQVRQ